MPNLEQRFIVAGADPVGKTPEYFADFMAKETAKWKKVVEDSNAAQK
jgi:tripartite-type tricarboxylate transporter receptor subunit TctC